MHQKIILFFFLISSAIYSQNNLGRPFITGNINLVLSLNENYVLFEPDDGENLLIPTGVFARFGFGYEFKKRVAISFNTGYDYHWNYAVSAIPTFASLRYNITEIEDDTFFVEASYGKMFRQSSAYNDGNYSGFGLGYQIAGEERWNTIIRLDFHRKAIFGFDQNRLDSVSFGIGFSFF